MVAGRRMPAHGRRRQLVSAFMAQPSCESARVMARTMGAAAHASRVRQGSGLSLHVLCKFRLRVYDLPPEALDQPGLQHAAKTGSDSDDGVATLPDNLPAVLHVDEGETVYDYAWYPGMLASEPASCVFATTVRVRVEAHLPWHYVGMRVSNCLQIS